MLSYFDDQDFYIEIFDSGFLITGLRLLAPAMRGVDKQKSC